MIPVTWAKSKRQTYPDHELGGPAVSPCGDKAPWVTGAATECAAALKTRTRMPHIPGSVGDAEPLPQIIKGANSERSSVPTKLITPTANSPTVTATTSWHC